MSNSPSLQVSTTKHLCRIFTATFDGVSVSIQRAQTLLRLCVSQHQPFVFCFCQPPRVLRGQVIEEGRSQHQFSLLSFEFSPADRHADAAQWAGRACKLRSTSPHITRTYSDRELSMNGGNGKCLYQQVIISI